MQHKMETRQAPQTDEQEAGGVERRFFTIEARAKKSDDGNMQVGGYGALFGKYTRIGWFAEVVEPGFFDGIKDDRCACLFNHDVNQILGRKKNGTLELKTDKSGLDYTSKLPDHRADVYELVSKGYVYESSFGFTVADETWHEVDRALLDGKLDTRDLDALTYGGKIAVRHLIKGEELYDVSPVTFAAYEGTTTDTRIAKRSFDAWKGAEGMAEQREKLATQQQDQNTRAAKALAEAALALY